MTEAEWHLCTDPLPMLSFLAHRVTDRKARLFAVACCRRIWRSLKDPALQHAVEVAERFADGTAGEEERLHARNRADETWNPQDNASVSSYASRAVTSTVGDGREYIWDSLTARCINPIGCQELMAGKAAAAVYCCAIVSRDMQPIPAFPEPPSLIRRLWNSLTLHRVPTPQELHWLALHKQERFAQSELLRDIIGDPFRPTGFSSIWRSHSNSLVGNLAATIYADRSFHELPILADALEDAGCSDSHILEHCRSGKDHVRGCWVVDLCLDKR